MYESMGSYNAEPVPSTDSSGKEEAPAKPVLTEQTLDDMLDSVVTDKPNSNSDEPLSVYANQTPVENSYSGNEPSHSYRSSSDDEDDQWGSIKYNH